MLESDDQSFKLQGHTTLVGNRINATEFKALAISSKSGGIIIHS